MCPRSRGRVLTGGGVSHDSVPPVEPQPSIVSAGDLTRGASTENRTRFIWLEARGTANIPCPHTTLHLTPPRIGRCQQWSLKPVCYRHGSGRRSGRWGSNPWPLSWQDSVQPLNYARTQVGGAGFGPAVSPVRGERRLQTLPTTDRLTWQDSDLRPSG